MKRIIECLIVTITTLLIFSTYAIAKPLKIQILPKRISPGDAFMIKISGLKTQCEPIVSSDREDYSFSSCGEGCYVAIGAVDIKTKPGRYTVKVKIGGKGKNLKMVVIKKRFPKVKISLPDEKVILSPEDLNRVEGENERLGEIFKTVSDRMWDGDFKLPLENCISTVFGTNRLMNGKLTSVHKGVDIKGKEGEEIHASNSGRVVFADELFFGGKSVILDHGQGIYTVYMHLSKFMAKYGDDVSKGEVIGYVGSTGRATGPHLHFGAKVMDINTNPVSLIKLEL